MLALHRAGTLSAAALALATTHTTIGRRLRTIESRLGTRLFDRTPDGYVATAAGDDVALLAARVEEDVHALEARVLGRDVRLAGELRVATMDMLLRHHHRLFEAFASRYPSVELTVCSSDREVSLTRREADVALRMTRTPPDNLIGKRVGRVEFAVYASRALVRRVGADAPLSAYPWLHWDRRLGYDWLDEWLAHHAPGARIKLRLDVGTSMLRDVIAEGFAVHFLATLEGDADRRLVRISPVASEFERALWLLTLPELRHTPRVRAFMDHATAMLGEPKPEDAASKRRR